MLKMRDPYLYADCPVLKNKLGIKDASLLDKAEIDITCNAIYNITVSPIDGNYDFDHLCKFHACISGNIYDWAGTPRAVAMEKGEAVLGYMSIEYAHPLHINKEAATVLNRLNNTDWNSLSLENQARELSDRLAELWKIHPFREGNTRTIITFICQFAESKGLALDRTLFEQNAVYMRNALVAATAIFRDGDFRKPEYLFRIVKDSLELGTGKKTVL